MLFNSAEFIFLFLPIALIGAHLLQAFGRRAVLVWLTAASLFFYGFWDPRFLPLLIVLMLCNYYLGSLLGGRHSKSILALGITGNLLVLGYFKYAGFIGGNIKFISGFDLGMGNVILPLGISFFTFQKIAYLIDRHRGLTTQHSILEYSLFVAFFPQLIAGPIVHQNEMLPQLVRRTRALGTPHEIATGVSFFILGLFKKVIIADGVANYASPIFNTAASGGPLSLVEAWSGVLAYSLQIYFDFSGYTDMAIGLGLMFGVYLPLNFNSPYKAENIIEFWRRWHMTLSRFLRDYLYIPLGGGRTGPFRRYFNLMLVMALGGLWHGASWTFVLWGTLHGLLLIINHGWRAVGPVADIEDVKLGAAGRALSVGLTFFTVAVAWVFFRASDWQSAVRVLSSMTGTSGAFLPDSYAVALGPLAGVLRGWGWQFVSPDQMPNFSGVTEILWLSLLLGIIWFAPNSQQVLGYLPPGAIGHAQLGPAAIEGARPLDRRMAVALGVMAAIAVFSLAKPSEFLYFQF